MRQERWTKIRDFVVVNLVGVGTIMLSVLLGLGAVILWLKEISYIYPGPAWAALGLAFIVLIIGLLLNDLQTHNKKLSQHTDNAESLPRLVGLEVLVNRWQTFRTEIDQSDSEMIYEQLLIAQQIFADRPQITFEKSFPGTKPEKGAFLVQGVPRARILKFDHLENIRKERDRFTHCVLEGLSRHTPGKPIAYWPPEFDWNRMDGNKHAAVVYDLAQLGQAGPQTFGEYYAGRESAAVVKVLQKLLAVMAPSWLEPPSLDHSWWDSPVNQNQTHGCPRKSTNPGQRSLYYEYLRLKENFDRIEQGLKMTLADCNVTLQLIDAGQAFNLGGIDIQSAVRFCHPIHWVRDVFHSPDIFNARYGYLDSSDNRRDSIVHGDFHSGNILIEEQQGVPRIWLIDFPHTHIGPTVQDIARLEADIKFALFPKEFLADRKNFETMLAFEDQILGNGTRGSLDLSDKSRLAAGEVLSSVDAELDKVWQALAILRRPVREHNLIPGDAKPYYLALLHATLPMLYYDDLICWQKLYAFVSAALLCGRLDGGCQN